jgi:hypothetical protein
MSDPTVYELLSDKIDGGFERQEAATDRLSALQRDMNGRVTDAHLKIAVHDEQLRGGSKRLDALGERTHVLSNMLQPLPQLVVDVRKLGESLASVPAMIAGVQAKFETEMRAIERRLPSGARKGLDRPLTVRDVTAAGLVLSAMYTAIKAFGWKLL